MLALTARKGAADRNERLEAPNPCAQCTTAAAAPADDAMAADAPFGGADEGASRGRAGGDTSR